jgi:rhodanese-related sulfurtransferase
VDEVAEAWKVPIESGQMANLSAALAGKLLKDMGYDKVYNVGGFKDWTGAGRKDITIFELTARRGQPG